MQALELRTPIGLISNIYSIHEDIPSYAWNNVDVDFHTTVDGGGIQGRILWKMKMISFLEIQIQEWYNNVGFPYECMNYITTGLQ